MHTAAAYMPMICFAHLQRSFKVCQSRKIFWCDVERLESGCICMKRSWPKLKPIFTNLKKRFEHMVLPAKLLDYFLRSNKSNINQSHTCDNAQPHGMHSDTFKDFYTGRIESIQQPRPESAQESLNTQEMCLNQCLTCICSQVFFV